MEQIPSVTWHMGSHSVTCHPTQVNTPRLNPGLLRVLESAWIRFSKTPCIVSTRRLLRPWYMPRMRFRPRLRSGPSWGSSWRSPRLPSRLGRGDTLSPRTSAPLVPSAPRFSHLCLYILCMVLESPWKVLEFDFHKWARTLLTTARQAGTRFAYPGGIEGWVNLGDWLHTEMVYPPADGHPSKYWPGSGWPGVELTTCWSQVDALTATTKLPKSNIHRGSFTLFNFWRVTGKKGR